MSEPPTVTITTDGSCVGNPGPGGFAALLKCGDTERHVTGGRRHTTNNRMELLAAIAGLDALKRPCRVTVRSDSKYLVDSVSRGWAAAWRAGGRLRSNDSTLNADLWVRLLDACGVHEVEFVWVRGHAGDPANEYCHRLASEAARGREWPADAGYDAHLARAASQRTLFA